MYKSLLRVPLIHVKPRTLWFGTASTLFYFPLPKGAVWHKQVDTMVHQWLFRYSDEARSFFRRLQTYASWFSQIFFLKFRMRGLGYRFRPITPSLFRFYFTKTNYIYFHCPPSIRLFSRKRRIILLSSNRHHLHLVFSHILKLHKAGPYNRRGFTFPRRVFRRKPGKKVL